MDHRPVSWVQRLRTALSLRIIAWSFVPTFIILGAVAAFTYYTYWQVTGRLVMDRNRELTVLAAGQFSAELDGYVEQLDAVARSRDITRLNPAYQSSLLRWSVSDLREFDGGVVILDREGRVVATDPRRPDAVGQDWSNRSYFRQISVTPANVPLSDIEYDAEDGGPVVAVALPIRGEGGQFIGVVAGMFLLTEEQPNALHRTVLKNHLRTESHVLLIDSRGRTIDYSLPARIGKEDPSSIAAAGIARGDSGAMRTRDASGRDIIASFAPVPGSSWGLIEHETWGQITMESTRYGRLLLALLILGLLVPSGFVAIGTRRIMRPVAQVTDAARNMAAGNLEQMVALPRERELAELAGSFNRMSAELSDVYAGLEAKVATRTRELGMLNRLASELSRSLDMRDTLDVTLSHALEAVGLRQGLAYRLDADGAYHLAASHGLSGATPEPLERLPSDQLAWALVAPTTAPKRISLADVAPADGLRALVAQGWAGIVALPLAAKDRSLGLVLLGDHQSRDITDEERSLLSAIATQAGMAAENARLYEQAEETAVAAERSRLARELHDSVTQTLFSASLIAGVIPLLWEASPDEARLRHEELRLLTEGALAEMRSLLFELRPAALLEARLTDLLAQLCAACAGRGRLPIALDAPREPRMPPEARIALYRIAQEALNNILKHAGASHVTVSLEAEDEAHPVRLCITDDGRGFDASATYQGRLGLSIMQERASAVGASLVVESAYGRGTSVTVIWPAVPPAVGA